MDVTVDAIDSPCHMICTAIKLDDYTVPILCSNLFGSLAFVVGAILFLLECNE